MTRKTTDYLSEARKDAQNMALEYLDQIMEYLTGGNDVSKNLLNDYSGADSYHHENHVDRGYGLSDAAELLDQLSDYEETDSGLWEMHEPRQAVCIQAAYTYGNAVYQIWQRIVEDINRAAQTAPLADALQDLEAGEIDEAQVRAIVESVIRDE